MNWKTWTLISLLSLTTACSKMVKEDPYVKANKGKTLSSIDQNDAPNTSNALSVPAVDQIHDGVPNDRPPEMAFARKRSQNEDVIINDRNGQPTIELYNDISPWELMIADFGSNWQMLKEDPENCQVTLSYDDPIAKQRSEESAFKKFFGTRNKYEDKSGNYLLNCNVEDNKNLITLVTADGQIPSPHVVDDLFAYIFVKASE